MGGSAANVDTGRFLREAQARQDPDSDVATGRPVITTLPDGYVVVEQCVGRATAEWMLHIRCECGYAWFEGEAKESTRCAECGKQVYLDIQPPGP